MSDLYHLSEHVEGVVIWNGTGKDDTRPGTKPAVRPAPAPRPSRRRATRVSASETRRRILAALLAAGAPLTKPEIRTRIDTAESTTNDAIALLVHQGLVQSAGLSPRPSRYSNGLKRFALTPIGHREATRNQAERDRYKEHI